MQSYISVNLESSGRIENSKRKSKGGTSGAHRRHQDDGNLLSRERLKYWLRKLITLLFSQVGVGSLLVCYTILGAMLFISIESDVDSRRLSQVASLRSSTVLQLWNATQNYNVLYGNEWGKDVDQIVRHFQKGLVEEIKQGYGGSDVKPQWTFPQALMFSLSVYTTIGYGNLTPKTDLGKATTCVYAMFGIPLLLLYMANVGDLLATSFQQFYRTLNRCKTRLNKLMELSREKKREVERMNRTEENEQIEALIVGDVRSKPSIFSAVTAGPNYCDYRKMGQTEVKEDSKQIETIATIDGGSTAAVATGKHHRRVVLAVNETSSEDINEREANEVTTIPISACLSVFFCYILFGSILFSWWEGWEYFEGSYFCFVSLVTIGFSDMVPGKSRGIGLALSPGSLAISAAADSKSTDEKGISRTITNGGITTENAGNDADGNDIVVGGGSGAEGNHDGRSAPGSNVREESLDHHVDGQLILCSIYILFGMALMAMCFHLTQERFFATAKKLGKTLHLI